MEQNSITILENRIDKKNLSKLSQIDNPELHKFISTFINLCNPSKIFVCTDDEKDIDYIRQSAITNNEEAQLAKKNHTIHFDGYYDQARDKDNTKFLIPKYINLGPEINVIEKEKGQKEIHQKLRNIMMGHELYIKFFCLGPPGSDFIIPCVQLTDSAYVAHSEDLLYRLGFNEFCRLGKSARFFKFVHSQGELTKAGLDLLVSKKINKRRIYINLEDETIYSVNTQYGGNTIGLKKLAMRLAINRASKEGWLTEHMLIMGVNGPKNRRSYFTGAFPSMCGKTSTAMVENETIVGDDIAYLRAINGECRAVNVEKGLFGIIEGINSVDDPLQWKALHSTNEIIFSNILVTDDGNVFWNGKEKDIPKKGVNFSGNWFQGKKDRNGNEIFASHKNARFTLDLKILDNVDLKLNDKNGVKINGIIYGGRDSNTSVPVSEAFNWEHGIITKGASLESETTAATLGKEGIRAFNPMSNIDFLSIPIGKYVQDNLNFGNSLKTRPSIFSVNYFLKDKDGKFLNHKNDKRVWLKWMELRVNNDVDAIKTPVGFIPLYSDLKRLFKQILNKNYSKEEYVKQFTIRIPENIEKIKRINFIYSKRVYDTPQKLFEVLEEEKERLITAQNEFGDYLIPEIK